MKKPFLVVLIMFFTVVVFSAFIRVGGEYKNLQILPKDITEKQMDSVMNHFTKSLNVGCDFCHTKIKKFPAEDWDWASDINKHKLAARDMMKMTNKLNDDYFP